MINKEYETQVAMAEAYAAAYCNARELTGISPVWSGVRAGYLQALQDSKKVITDSDRLDWVIENRAWIQNYHQRFGVVTSHVSDSSGKYFDTPREAIDACLKLEREK